MIDHVDALDQYSYTHTKGVLSTIYEQLDTQEDKKYGLRYSIKTIPPAISSGDRKQSAKSKRVYRIGSIANDIILNSDNLWHEMSQRYFKNIKSATRINDGSSYKEQFIVTLNSFSIETEKKRYLEFISALSAKDNLQHEVRDLPSEFFDDDFLSHFEFMKELIDHVDLRHPSIAKGVDQANIKYMTHWQNAFNDDVFWEKCLKYLLANRNAMSGDSNECYISSRFSNRKNYYLLWKNTLVLFTNSNGDISKIENLKDRSMLVLHNNRNSLVLYQKDPSRYLPVFVVIVNTKGEVESVQQVSSQLDAKGRIQTTTKKVPYKILNVKPCENSGLPIVSSVVNVPAEMNPQLMSKLASTKKQINQKMQDQALKRQGASLIVTPKMESESLIKGNILNSSRSFGDTIIPSKNNNNNSNNDDDSSSNNNNNNTTDDEISGSNTRNGRLIDYDKIPGLLKERTIRCEGDTLSCIEEDVPSVFFDTVTKKVYDFRVGHAYSMPFDDREYFYAVLDNRNRDTVNGEQYAELTKYPWTNFQKNSPVHLTATIQIVDTSIDMMNEIELNNSILSSSGSSTSTTIKNMERYIQPSILVKDTSDFGNTKGRFLSTALFIIDDPNTIQRHTQKYSSMK